jgi:hypothetical protein
MMRHPKHCSETKMGDVVYNYSKSRLSEQLSLTKNLCSSAFLTSFMSFFYVAEHLFKLLLIQGATFVRIELCHHPGDEIVTLPQQKFGQLVSVNASVSVGIS